MIPHWHIDVFRVAYWNKLNRPVISPKYALGFDTWWLDPGKAEDNRREDTPRARGELQP